MYTNPNVAATIKEKITTVVTGMATIPKFSERWSLLNGVYHELLIEWATARQAKAESTPTYN